MKNLGFKARLAIPLAVCGLLTGLAPRMRAQDKSQLGGQWNINEGESDNARAKIQGAREQSSAGRRRSGGNYPSGGGNDPSGEDYPGGGVPYPGGGGTYPRGGGYPGGGYPGGGIGGPIGGIGFPGGRRGRGGMERQPRGLSEQEMEMLASAPKLLRVDLQEKRIVLTDDDGQVRNLYPDGKKHSEKDVNGEKISTKTQWEGSQLVVERKAGRSGKLTELYRVSSDGKELFVTARLEDPALSQPLSIQRVYDRAGSKPKASDK
ncbi:MAG: hypothetical protein ACE145_07090 [Terriglobia bacterium]